MTGSARVSGPGRLAACLVLLAISGAAAGGTIGVRVLDRGGAPVPGVVVHARPIGETAAAEQPVTARATMNQRDLAFRPHVLVVQAGTAVEFPNEDAVRHHVYSFSATRRLNLSVDAGHIHEPLRFETPGVVTLGCNIHDEMLAYILIVDTPHFTKTNGDGAAVLTGLARERYEVHVWTPRLAAKNMPDPVEAAPSAEDAAAVQIRFDAKLFPPHRHGETSLSWEQY